MAPISLPFPRQKFLQISVPLAHALKSLNKSSLLAQVLFTLLPLCCVLEGVRLCARPLRVESWFPLALWLSWS